MSEAQDKTVTFDRMPGADQLEEGANDRLDMNFGLGQEPEPAPEPESNAKLPDAAVTFFESLKKAG